MSESIFVEELQELAKKHKMTMSGWGVDGAVFVVTFQKEYGFQPGDTVVIEGYETRLVNRCNEEGGWRVDPRVGNFSLWNEDVMRLKHAVV